MVLKSISQLVAIRRQLQINPNTDICNNSIFCRENFIESTKCSLNNTNKHLKLVARTYCGHSVLEHDNNRLFLKENAVFTVVYDALQFMECLVKFRKKIYKENTFNI